MTLLGQVVESATDPSVLFVFACALLPPFLALPDTALVGRQLLAHVADPTLLTALALLVLTVASTSNGNGKKVSVPGRDERRAARWLLVNGAVIHFLMDGMVGCFHRLPQMDAQYRTLDNRFNIDQSDAWTTGWVELFIMSPLCFWTYWAIWRQKPYRDALQLITLTLEIAGTFFFTVSEIHDGFRDYKYCDRDLRFGFMNILYFWFGFFVNFVWLVVPLLFMRHPWRRISHTSIPDHDKKKN